MKTRREFFKGCGGLALGGVAAKLGIEAAPAVRAWHKVTATVPISDDLLADGGYLVNEDFAKAFAEMENVHFINGGMTPPVHVRCRCKDPEPITLEGFRAYLRGEGRR